MKTVNRFCLAAAGALVMAGAAYAEPVTHKFKQSGDGWRGRPWMGVVVVQDGNRIRPRRTEQTSAFSAIVGSWADYPAIAIRACKGSVDSFQETDCLTAKGAEISIPEGERVSDYNFEFKYRYGDAVRQDTFVLR